MHTKIKITYSNIFMFGQPSSHCDPLHIWSLWCKVAAKRFRDSQEYHVTVLVKRWGCRDTVYKRDSQSLSLRSLNDGEKAANADCKLAVGDGGDSSGPGLDTKLVEQNEKSVELDRTLSAGLWGTIGSSRCCWLRGSHQLATVDDDVGGMKSFSAVSDSVSTT